MARIFYLMTVFRNAQIDLTLRPQLNFVFTAEAGNRFWESGAVRTTCLGHGANMIASILVLFFVQGARVKVALDTRRVA